MSDDGFDWAAEAAGLAAHAYSDAEFYRIMAAELLRDTDRLAVDFGCGAAGMAVALRRRADERGGRTRVVGADSDAAAYAQTAARHPDISFVVASFEDSSRRIREHVDGAPDLIWARGALHHAADEQAALNTLVEVLAPGGVLAVAEGGTTVGRLPDHLDIGEPGVHHRLTAALHENYRNRMADALPMPYGWPIGLRNAGLTGIHTRNVPFDEPAPLEGADMDHMLRKYAKQVEWVEDLLEPGDVAAWHRLLDPDDKAWLGNRDDLYWLATASVHIGIKAS